MKDEDLFKIDFNSLKLLKVLGEEKSSKQAAQRLYITQSAVSKALSRLREQFNDDLFIRKKYSLEPTEKCVRLLNRLPTVMSCLDDLYGGLSDFNPENYTGDIKIQINSVLSYGIMANLFKKIHSLAPNATLVLENWSPITEQNIKQGTVDLGINLYPLELSKDITQIPICYPEFKLCFHKDSPLAKNKSVTPHEVANYPIVLAIQPSFNQKESLLIKHFKKRGLTPKILLRSDKVDICLETVRKIPSFMVVSEVVQKELFEELVLVDINHWEDVHHLPIACYLSHKLKVTPYSQWLIQVIQEAIDELY
ncbi:LysR family transcriptional regulator [Photobacterium sp. DNB22_13_2]